VFFQGRLLTGAYFGRPAIVKERFRKRYRHPVLDEKLTKERMKGEARSLLRSVLLIPFVSFVVKSCCPRPRSQYYITSYNASVVKKLQRS
jgi:hypothetical protein